MRRYDLPAKGDLSDVIDDKSGSAPYGPEHLPHGVRASDGTCDTCGLVSNARPLPRLPRPACAERIPTRSRLPSRPRAGRGGSGDVRNELRSPEFLPRGPCRRVRAADAPVPEAAVHEAHDTGSAEDQVRCPRESPVVQTESTPPGMIARRRPSFPSRVPASDPRHHVRTSRAVHDVRHPRCSSALGGTLQAYRSTGMTRKTANMDYRPRPSADPDEAHMPRQSEAGPR